ncbi:bifunctional phosphoribosyl-AMP cyclohydrolase/phosphoribosyl-ATP diphosphatase HisIE [Blattabacterium cuenoti]|uniref:bifunctional phosphoribosyl-AMP cyclohydrolase/phosphoribosyl-ATP diphosphatase HisIE n=1 Tax=Blattabacterium cuenoti TaxID=1653831 RepID=UPI00163C3213|nr:bifunctional phosphoribosyl-AMP cyclohydrolase/phosphoribosyl-ATP diphosphatase HisIE [Blattabacterium cuenoti]
MKKKFQSIYQKINFKNDIVPTIIQDYKSNLVLMLGFMNKESYKKSILDKKVTFYSRSKNRLWTKGETSNNFLFIKDILIDCDGDTLLIKVKPNGPVCHKKTDTCWKEINKRNFLFLLEEIILNRIFCKNEKNDSYVKKLYKKGMNRIIQKFGEESIELIIESKDNNDNNFLNEAADLLFHYLILLRKKNFTIKNVIDILEKRHLINI